MVTLLVVVVGDIQIGVNVVEAEGDLGADIQVGGLQVAVLLEGVELLQLVSVIRSGDGGDAQALDSVAVGSAVEGGVIGVSAGIDDGHLGACAGVTVSPGNAGADHGGGGSHVGSVVSDSLTTQGSYCVSIRTESTPLIFSIFSIWPY